MVATVDGHGFAYLQIAAALRADVASGTFAPGERIPSIRELADRFSVSAQTVQKAVAALSSEGIITAGSTRGYFVSNGAKAAVVQSDSQRLAALEEEFRLLTERVARLETGREG